MSIPVFHDDQHGTAIISGAALVNAVDLAGKEMSDLRVTFSGAGASAIATANFYISLGVDPDHITMCDSTGILTQQRAENGELNEYNREFARDIDEGSLADALEDADVFVGLSVADVADQDMIRSMNENPIVFAMANPDPEIGYEEAKSARDDTVIMATGRSDYPNQVNNVLGFPFIFRGALDVRASEINEEMKVAAARRARRTRARGRPGRGGEGLRRPAAPVRSRVHHPETRRPQSPLRGHARGCGGGGRERRGADARSTSRRTPRSSKPGSASPAR